MDLPMVHGTATRWHIAVEMSYEKFWQDNREYIFALLNLFQINFFNSSIEVLGVQLISLVEREPACRSVTKNHVESEKVRELC